MKTYWQKTAFAVAVMTITVLVMLLIADRRAQETRDKLLRELQQNPQSIWSAAPPDGPRQDWAGESDPPKLATKYLVSIVSHRGHEKAPEVKRITIVPASTTAGWVVSARAAQLDANGKESETSGGAMELSKDGKTLRIFESAEDKNGIQFWRDGYGWRANLKGQRVVFMEEVREGKP
jgi:hypothetical protein